MKNNRIFKKFAAIIMVFAILFAIPSSGLTAKASYSPVHMYYCDHVVNWRGWVQYNVYIQIDANSAANKSVCVHYNDGTNGWRDAEASFVTKTDSNTEIWKASVSTSQGKCEYAIKYVGDGKTYWDNNNGNNYTDSDILGTANVVVQRIPYQSANSYEIRAVVKNLAYEKVVKVRYTQDNWATWQEADLSYLAPTAYDTNTEIWKTTLNLDKNKMENFQFCISYKVNNQTYWDNNCGFNYDSSFYRPIG